jgi:hypothetical protein
MNPAIQVRSAADAQRIEELLAEIAALRQRCEAAEKHCRDHHLEPCETCIATEQQLAEARAECERLQAEVESFQQATWNALPIETRNQLIKDAMK